MIYAHKYKSTFGRRWQSYTCSYLISQIHKPELNLNNKLLKALIISIVY